MISIIDYDAGNMRSVENALRFLGADCRCTGDGDELLKADHVILPGVGAFGDAMSKLQGSGLVPVIHEILRKGTPFLGICLGLQLLFDGSKESPGVPGLGLLRGQIRRIPAVPETLKIPHMGWNSLQMEHPGRLLRGLDDGSFVYFVHSYYLEAEEPEIVTASAFYGTKIHAAVEKDNLFACQFHPEKSSDTGMRILQNFISL